MRQKAAECAAVIFNRGNVNCGGHRAKTCSQCLCNEQGNYLGYIQHGSKWCSGECQWNGDHLSGVCHMRQKSAKCGAGFIFNMGNIICGRHRAKTCSQCTCSQHGVDMGETGQGSGWCNGDCQWSNGACHMRRKINKGEWYSRDITIQGCWRGRGLGSVDLHMGI